jgi:hypothetical protein
MDLDFEITPEDEDEMIKNIANTIHKYGMDVAAILLIESIKPLSYIGAQMGRFFISPFLPAFSENLELGGEKFLQVFEKRENVEKLIVTIEELAKEEKAKKEAEKQRKLEEKSSRELGEVTEKKGWRRYLPF